MISNWTYRHQAHSHSSAYLECSLDVAWSDLTASIMAPYSHSTNSVQLSTPRQPVMRQLLDEKLPNTMKKIRHSLITLLDNRPNRNLFKLCKLSQRFNFEHGAICTLIYKPFVASLENNDILSNHRFHWNLTFRLLTQTGHFFNCLARMSCPEIKVGPISCSLKCYRREIGPATVSTLVLMQTYVYSTLKST